MRSSRKVKNRKKYKQLINVAKILVILYATLMSVSLLTSNTSAFFNNSKSLSHSISTGSWWDGSDLAFIGKGNQNLNDACPPVKFSVEIQNNGFSMIDSTNYEVFYIENGNPKNGEKVAEGMIDPIESGEIATISYQAEEEGFYAVKAFQRPDYEGESANVIWSEKIKVKCPNQNNEEQTDDVKPSEQGNTSENDKSSEEDKDGVKNQEEAKEEPKVPSKESSDKPGTEEETDTPREEAEKQNKQPSSEQEDAQENQQEESSTVNEEIDNEPNPPEVEEPEQNKPEESIEQEISQTVKSKEGEKE
ncbi:amyloid fiber anchoring/assembly protein TapA [Gracilibacillus sp. D59]|uniref:amyloid fiber anchoring/assembly protein TapA n=1 Tax=Gracilibacillus sp. D59 TaxID=3457434 RepID=UPI003FCDFAD7